MGPRAVRVTRSRRAGSPRTGWTTTTSRIARSCVTCRRRRRCSVSAPRPSCRQRGRLSAQRGLGIHQRQRDPCRWRGADCAPYLDVAGGRAEPAYQGFPQYRPPAMLDGPSDRPALKRGARLSRKARTPSRLSADIASRRSARLALHLRLQAFMRRRHHQSLDAAVGPRRPVGNRAASPPTSSSSEAAGTTLLTRPQSSASAALSTRLVR